LRWLARALSNLPRRWVNIHAGLDETTQLLSALFPSATGKALDIYDPREMTEPSIAQAREQARTASTIRSTPAHWNSLPIADDTLDAAFLIFVTHELRRHEARVKLFQELSRTLQRDGTIVLIEHTRGWANFLAFGPGFLHFFSKRTWRRAFSAAGLQISEEFPMTPFVRVFLLRRAA
jgi:ubiquinone/menaquinone biosynthesis C-methylase UbiE